MAEAVVSLVVEQLVSAAADWLGKELSLLKGVKRKLENMKDKMQIIQTLVEDAENQSLERTIVKLWLGKLQDVSYDMDDVLDEWNTRVQILEIEEAEENKTSDEIVGSSSSSSSPMTCISLKELNCFSVVKQLPWRREIALRIKDINQRIEWLVAEMKDFKLASNAVRDDDLDKIINSDSIDPNTTDSIDESKVFGRGNDKEFILRRVLTENTEHEKSLQVISILGAGGLGKTTLAQMICSDEKVKQTFPKKIIWVCVSNTFNEIKVAQAILEGLRGYHTEMENLNTVHRSIRESLVNKVKFLLVLDDVWDDDFLKWQRLISCLQGNENSRVLVTTRNPRVVETMGTTQSNILEPELISDSDCWLLMKQRVLQGNPNRDIYDLENIGKEIAKKCNGLPLAAKTLGGLLISKYSVQEWTEVLNSKIWELKIIQIHLFPHFYLSYQELPSVLKRCFLILALFPKDTFLKIEEVIQLWMTHGYLNLRTEQEDMVKTGQQYLKFLVSRAFLEEKKMSFDGKTLVSMHYIMHDFALYLIGDELLSIMVDDNTESGSTSKQTSKRGRKSMTARHFIINGKINQTSIDYDLGKLRTCILLKVPSYVTSNLINQLKMVRLLNLEDCDLRQVPESIMNLIHLRMLVLSHNPLVELPETIGNLFNLQHLFLEGLRLSSFPESLGKLVNLISLTPSSLAIQKAPESVSNLTNLQSLSRIQVGARKSHLGLLKDLNQLRVLEIVFQSHYDDELDAKSAAIGRKKHLTELTLDFYDYKVADGVVAALQPPPSIQTLTIMGLVPSWITFLDQLKDLQLKELRISTLPPLWELQSLEKIVISECVFLKTIDREFLGIGSPLSKDFCAYRKLVELIFFKCLALTEFEDLKPEEEGRIKVMPNLEILTFEGCCEFGEIPFRLLRQASSLKKLYIDERWSSFGLNVQAIYQGVAGDFWLSPFGESRDMSVKINSSINISDFTKSYITLVDLCFQPNISSLPSMGKLPHLESLTIRSFESVILIGRDFLGIDDEEFVAFPDLKSLEISGCDLLEEWTDLKPEDEGKIRVMPKLEKLEITRCPKFKVMPPRILSQLSSLKLLYLPVDDQPPR